jgi:hypothetical protein
MKITVLRILCFVVLVSAFFAYFGFDIPERGRSVTRIDDSWFYCAALFVVGAGCASFGDQEIGMFPPTSLRWLYVVVGVIIMAASAAWMTSIDQIARGKWKAASVQITPLRR